MDAGSWQKASPLIISGDKVRYNIPFTKPVEFYRLQRPARQ